ncbi:MAG: methionyl-tRNA formyltransferase [Bdellovibrionales bacterium]|nr:methionyl-tRNA formyltransferase [Bdellovibrionales bacterium]
MSKVRIVFLGTADFALPSLQMLCSDEHYEVVCVVTQPDKPAGRKLELTASPVKKLAQSLEIPIYTPANINTEEAINYIKKLRAEAAVVVAYGQILSEDIISLFPKGAVNLHGSLLPRWRGAAPVQRAIFYGDSESGVTLQKIALKLDAGDVLGVRKVSITDGMDSQELYDKLKNFGADLLHIEFMDYIRGNLTGIKQDTSLVTIAKKIKKEEGLIDWNKNQSDIWNQYKALKMWPGVWTIVNNKTLKIHKMEKVKSSGKPGKVISKDTNGLVIACNDGAFKLLEVQPESKAKMQIKDYLNGFEIPDNL